MRRDTCRKTSDGDCSLQIRWLSIKSASKLTITSWVVVTGLTSAPSFAQLQPAPALPNLSNVESILKLKGTTINMNVQDGSRSSLNFGSSTSMGVNVNMTTSEGTKTSASSQLTPQSGTIVFSIGKGAIAGETTADINNLRTEQNVDGDKSYGAQGQAKLTGVTSSLNLELDPAKTGFSAQTETLHQPAVLNEGVKGEDGKYIVEPYYQPGAQIGTGGQNSNAGASTNINSSTNVDINTTTFTNAFMQAF